MRGHIGLGAQPGQFDNLAGVVARVIVVRMSQVGPDHNVVEHCHALKGRGHLEGPADSELSVPFGRRVRHVLTGKDDSAASRCGIARKTVEKCRFASAIWSNQTYDLAFDNG